MKQELEKIVKLVVEGIPDARIRSKDEPIDYQASFMVGSLECIAQQIQFIAQELINELTEGESKE